MLTIGSVLDGRYKVLDQIGKGGMSVVYLARDEKLNQSCAIKEVRKDGVKNFEIVKQGLVAETDILKRLKHPSLPEIKDIIDTNDSFVIVMELIDGKSMDKVLEEYGPLPEDYVFEWAKQICAVFQYLHTRTPPIIYRDMKPSNIMLKPDGSICIIDFGTAREFKEKNIKDTTTLGTVGYAAPEQYGGSGQRQSDARTDIYTLGATLYHLVTGYSPNPSAPPYYGMVPIRQINPNLSPALEEIILKCCQQKPEDRYQDCMELLYDLTTLRGQDITQDRRNFRLFFTTSAICVGLAFVASILLILSSALRTQDYNNKIADAINPTRGYSSEQRIEKLSKAIDVKPGKLKAYEALLRVASSNETEDVVICDDPEFTSEEATIFQKAYENKSLVKDDRSGYGELSYRIGRAYWFNYMTGNETVTDETRIMRAATWFNQARTYLDEDDQDYNLANLYYQVADFAMTISSREKQGEEAGAYEESWRVLRDMADAVANEKDYVRMQAYLTIVNTFNRSSSHYLREVGRSECESLLNKVRDNLNALSFQDEANNTALKKAKESMDSAFTALSFESERED